MKMLALFEAVRVALNEVIGAYAIVVMKKAIENELIVAEKVVHWLLAW